mgnify:CR=1 FL=1
MNEKSWLQARNSRSDNLKSKTCPESYLKDPKSKIGGDYRGLCHIRVVWGCDRSAAAKESSHNR